MVKVGPESSPKRLDQLGYDLEKVRYDSIVRFIEYWCRLILVQGDDNL